MNEKLLFHFGKTACRGKARKKSESIVGCAAMIDQSWQRDYDIFIRCMRQHQKS